MDYDVLVEQCFGRHERREVLLFVENMLSKAQARRSIESRLTQNCQILAIMEVANQSIKSVSR